MYFLNKNTCTFFKQNIGLYVYFLNKNTCTFFKQNIGLNYVYFLVKNQAISHSKIKEQKSRRYRIVQKMYCLIRKGSLHSRIRCILPPCGCLGRYTSRTEGIFPNIEHRTMQNIPHWEGCPFWRPPWCNKLACRDPRQR